MNIYRVSFIGHRDIDDYREVENRLNEIIPDVLKNKDFVEFMIGRNGEFDIFAASYIKRLVKSLGYGREKCVLILVLPYLVANIPYYEKYYDDVIIPEKIAKVHYKAAITGRNKWLVDNSDMLIAYVKRDEGGAAECLRYATKKQKRIKRI